MARNEHDREDLMREATGLVERLQLNVPAFDEPIVIGFRRNGSGSIFAGQDFVIQFNALNQLRRVYDSGRLIKAERRNLVALSRRRTDNAVLLVRHEFDQCESRLLLERVQGLLAILTAALQGVRSCEGYPTVNAPEERAVVTAVVSPSGDIIERAHQWLRDLQATAIVIAVDARA